MTNFDAQLNVYGCFFMILQNYNFQKFVNFYQFGYRFRVYVILEIKRFFIYSCFLHFPN